MRRFDHFAVGVSNGAVDLFSAFEEGGQMWVGNGPRLETVKVSFPEPFAEPPVVHLSLGMWDIGVNANQRADLKAADITAEGFRIEFRTWGDTRVARVRANWLAIGPVRHVDDFDA
ncbi:H-type lectin domain-containing protein [Paracoccus shanxieyensis]|uniref:H-type lectin domain-containing protein n=1 Tax=Paracoccus shanxieyensis TaxID=2675752 RepID=A0A6L6J0K1_9RHOB|nr:H-type lectin domain-containing protein [Paracoccus shanxieyensis]MTH65411.1 hypothetical protein [Paracoccus shanxieyensis]MTH88556.1 hypothetical protein [Paracoccus shanxieyensis]